MPLSEKNARLWTATVLLMALCVIATAWFPLLSITALPSENYNEGWNAYRQWMTVEGQPLYGDHPIFWTTNYPFLSFHIIGMMGAVKQNMVEAGRTVSFLSLIATSLLIGGIIREVTASRAGAIYAGLCLFAWLAGFFGTGRAADDPELLSLAMSSFGLFAFFRARERDLWIAVSAIAFAVSLFTKHDLIAFPLSIGIYFLMNRSWRALAVFCAAGFATGGFLLALSFHIDGRYFFAELLQPRAYDAQNLSSETLHYLLHFLIPLVIGVAVLLFDRSIPYRNLLFILLIFTNLFSVYFSGGDGVASNIFYAPFVADLLACIIAICQLEATMRRRSFQLALAIATLAGAAMVPSQVHSDVMAQLRMQANTRAALQAINLLASTRGPAICEDLLLCYQAGKPMAYDPYYVEDQIRIGRVQERSILAAVAAHDYAVIQIDGTLNNASLGRRKDERFTKSFFLTLLSAYRPVFVTPDYSIFVPNNYGSGASLSRITNARAAGG